MSPSYKAALDEFRDASAAVRLAFSARDAAREAQIIANRRYNEAAETLLQAQDRLDRADGALNVVKDEPITPAGWNGIEPVSQGE